MSETLTLRDRALPQERKLVTAIPGPRSIELQRRRNAAVAHGMGSTLPVYVERAGGGVLVDVDGNSLIDLGSGIAVTTVGNSAPRVVAGIVRQAESFTHTCFMVTPYEGFVAVCEALNRLTPGDHEKRSVLFNSGAEAVENAVKIARAYTGRQAIIVFDHAFHGRTNLTMALTAKNLPYKQGFGPFAPEIYRVPMSYPLRDGGLTGPEAAARAIGLIESQVGASQVAAVLIEPIQGEGGFIVPAPGFLGALADWTKKAGAVFIADEVQSGFGRTGVWFASETEGIVPDLVTTAKGLGGGMPISGVTGRAEIMDAPQVGGLGGTYSGNPLACAAALAAVAEIEENHLLERALQIEDRIRARLEQVAKTSPIVGELRGRGAMIALEFVKPGGIEPDAAVASRIAKSLHAEGIVVLTCGTFSNVIRLLPPLSIPDALLDEALDALATTIRANS